MITLHLLQLLQDNGFGTIDQSLFWEKMPLDKTGIGIISRGGPQPNGSWYIQPFDLYSRGENDLVGADALEKICEYITPNGIVCTLPTVPGKSNKIYKSVRIIPTGTIDNLGLDEGDRLLWRWSYQVTYNK